MFGHTIQLNFNKQGDSHQTAIGGFFSIFIRVAMLVYVAYNFAKMIFYQDDSNFTEAIPLNLDEFGDKNYNETDMFMYHVISKQKTGRVKLNDETYRHIDINYV